MRIFQLLFVKEVVHIALSLGLILCFHELVMRLCLIQAERRAAVVSRSLDTRLHWRSI